ncbi:MAG: histidine kinase [Lewinellaceae bacterium]|nr:histidine kinase [Lewinellaceae bacterium]
MLNQIFSGRTRLITHLTGWMLVFFVFFYLISGLTGPQEALARTSVNMVFLLTLFYGNAKILVNRFFETGRYRWWLLLSAVFWLGMAALRTWTERNFFGGGIFRDIAAIPDGSGYRLFLGYALSFLLLLVFSALYQLLENRRELEARHAEAQLNYLKAQINPHFLFNTLNNIYAAATLQHPRTADMVLRLSDVLRYVTYDAQADRVPMGKEIGQIHAYLDLFRIKSEQALPIRFDIKGDTTNLEIEPLLLLPLVENALKHGDLEDNPDGFLHILLQNEPGRLLFEVENSFNPRNVQKDEIGGVGLENIRKRLELNYRGRHSFKTIRQSNTFKSMLELQVI